MQNGIPAVLNGKKLQSYQQSQILSMEPVPLLIKVYDFTILNCKKKNMEKAGKGLVELISTLNFDYPDVSLGLFRLYQYCQDKIREEKYDEVISILEGLRNAWIETLKKEMIVKQE